MAIHQRWMLERMKDIIMVPETEPGMLDRQTYNRVVRVLFDAGFIHAAPMFETFYQGEAHAP